MKKILFFLPTAILLAVTSEVSAGGHVNWAIAIGGPGYALSVGQGGMPYYGQQPYYGPRPYNSQVQMQFYAPPPVYTQPMYRPQRQMCPQVCPRDSVPVISPDNQFTCRLINYPPYPDERPC